MNGRVYDPVLGRFLSPDNFVQAPDFTQNFNRYAYCLNNPLIYTDPSGDFILTTLCLLIPGAQPLLPFAIAGDMRGLMNIAINWNSIDNIGEGTAAYVAGTANGILTTINPIWGSALGEGIERGVNSLITQTGNGVGLNEVDWGNVGHESLYGFGGGLFSGYISKDFTIPIKDNVKFEFSLMGKDGLIHNSINHIIRSTAYHIGGNVFTGNAAFKGFNRHFIGLDGSLAIPLLMDGSSYLSKNSRWAKNYLDNKNIISNRIDDLRQKLINLSEGELILGNITYDFSDVTAGFYPDGSFGVNGMLNLYVNGRFASGGNYSDVFPFFLSRKSNLNFRSLFTLFYK